MTVEQLVDDIIQALDAEYVRLVKAKERQRILRPNRREHLVLTERQQGILDARDIVRKVASL